MFKRPNKSVLLILVIILILSIFLLELSKTRVKVKSYDTRVLAYENMERYKEMIRNKKLDMGISIDESIDINRTGLIGVDFSGITTTLGSLESKRASSNSEMASFLVLLLEEKGLGSGDRIGAVFSGSFLGLDLALIAACEAMEIDIIHISSIGASTFGANNEEFTLPEMIDLLYREGLIIRPSIAYSIGGTNDIGLDMDQEVLKKIIDRTIALNSEFIYEDDYNINLNKRMEILESEGELDAFVNIGGHTSGLGRGENSLYYKPGWQSVEYNITENSGLIEIYIAKGIPTLHLLNIKQLTTNYNIPFDPVYYSNEDKISASILYKYSYKIGIVYGTLLIILSIFIYDYRRRID